MYYQTRSIPNQKKILIFFYFYFKIVVINEEPLSAVSDISNGNDDNSSDLDDTPSSIKCSPGFFVGKNGTTVELLGQDLWKKFHKLGTEMIITKAGR